MALVQPRPYSVGTQRTRAERHTVILFQSAEIPCKRTHRSHPLTGSYQSATVSRIFSSSTDYDAVTQKDAVGDDAGATRSGQSNGNVSTSTDTSTSKAAADPQSSWGVSPAPEEDWQGGKPFTLKDVDWGKQMV